MEFISSFGALTEKSWVLDLSYIRTKIRHFEHQSGFSTFFNTKIDFIFPSSLLFSSITHTNLFILSYLNCFITFKLCAFKMNTCNQPISDPNIPNSDQSPSLSTGAHILSVSQQQPSQNSVNAQCFNPIFSCKNYLSNINESEEADKHIFSMPNQQLTGSLKERLEKLIKSKIFLLIKKQKKAINQSLSI